MTASAVVFVEEPSARVVIDEICKNLNLHHFVQVLEHQGKGDLERSITRKINGWRAPLPARFVISRDLDRSDRTFLKARLMNLVPEHAKNRTKVRIVIPELEAWYLGDPAALVSAGLLTTQSASRISNSAKFRNLCTLQNAKIEFKKLVGPIGQIHAAREIAPFLNVSNNQSANFSAFVTALHWACDQAPR